MASGNAGLTNTASSLFGGRTGLASPGVNSAKGAKPKPITNITATALANHPLWASGPTGVAPKPPGGVAAAGTSLLNLAGNLTQPQTPAAPAAPAQPAQPTGAAGSPLDSTYYNQVADYTNKTGNAIAADQAKIGNYDTSLQSTLGQLAYQQPRDALALMQKANAGGGLFSSVYGQNQGNLQHAYTLKQTAAQQAHDNAVNALATEISQLQGSEDPNSPTMIGFGLASAQRAATAAGNNPALGENPPVTPAPAPASPARPAAPAKTKGKATGVGSALLNLAGNLTRGKK